MISKIKIFFDREFFSDIESVFSIIEKMNVKFKNEIPFCEFEFQFNDCEFKNYIINSVIVDDNKKIMIFDGKSYFFVDNIESLQNY